MKNVIKSMIVLAVIAALSINYSCKKNDTGGKAEIHAMIFHGTTPIVGTTTLYVKFDATSKPANPVSDHDLMLMGEPDDNHVHVEELRPGNYYLYAMAYDSLAQTAVQGGAAVTIKWSERKKMIEVKVPVE